MLRILSGTRSHVDLNKSRHTRTRRLSNILQNSQRMVHLPNSLLDITLYVLDARILSDDFLGQSKNCKAIRPTNAVSHTLLAFEHRYITTNAELLTHPQPLALSCWSSPVQRCFSYAVQPRHCLRWLWPSALASAPQR